MLCNFTIGDWLNESFISFPHQVNDKSMRYFTLLFRSIQRNYYCFYEFYTVQVSGLRVITYENQFLQNFTADDGFSSSTTIEKKRILV